MTSKAHGFGALCAALARAAGWTAMERGILLVLLERAEPSRGWSTSLGIRDIAALAGCGRSSVSQCLAVAEAAGVIARDGLPGMPPTMRIIPDSWAASAAPTRLPHGHPPLATRTPPACHADTPACHADTPACHADTPACHADTPACHADTSHVIGVGARAPVAAPLSDPLSDPQSRVREGARTHARAAPIPAHGSEPRAPASDLPSKPAQTVADLVAVVLACRPGVDARGRGRGISISPVEERQLGELAAAHGVRAVEAVLLEHCGGAERPVTMAASRLSAAKSGDQTRRPFQQPTESRPQAFRIVDTDAAPEPEPPRTDDEIARRRALWAAAVAGYPDLAELAIDTATA